MQLACWIKLYVVFMQYYSQIKYSLCINQLFIKVYTKRNTKHVYGL